MGRREQWGKNWDKCNRITTKMISKKEMGCRKGLSGLKGTLIAKRNPFFHLHDLMWVQKNKYTRQVDEN